MMRYATVLMMLLAAAACSPGTPDAGSQTSDEWNEIPLPDHVFHEQTTPTAYRQETLSIDVVPGPGLEIKMRMREGDSVVYTWRAEGLEMPEDLVSEFHGHTDREEGERGTLVYYRKATGDTESGSLIAPFEGIHGWYWRNDSYTPIVVHLTVAGHFDSIGPP
jgi:hypothetical protein